MARRWQMNISQDDSLDWSLATTQEPKPSLKPRHNVVYDINQLSSSFETGLRISLNTVGDCQLHSPIKQTSSRLPSLQNYRSAGFRNVNNRAAAGSKALCARQAYACERNNLQTMTSLFSILSHLAGERPVSNLCSAFSDPLS